MRNLILIPLALFLIVSCKPANNPEIYKPGREWVFSVNYSDMPQIDTLRLRTLELAESIGVESEWITRSYYPNGNIRKEAVLPFKLIELRLEGSVSEVIDQYIKLKPPAEFNDSLRLVPYPTVELPPTPGWVEEDYQHTNEKITKHGSITPDGDTVYHKRKPEFWEEMEVSGSIKNSGRKYYDNPVVRDSCWVINAAGTSEVGKFNSRYYFHEEKGFVRFEYFLAGDTIRIDLVEIIQ
jgi:hypothetical protein